MASITLIATTDVFAKSMFDFDYFSYSNFKISGTVKVTLSDAFSYDTYLLSVIFGIPISNDVWSDTFFTSNYNWTTDQKNNIDLIFSTYSQLINLKFSSAISAAGYTPAQIGLLSDINISLIFRNDLSFGGMSSINLDTIFGYTGARLDIVINDPKLGINIFNDITFGADSYGWHTLMHEIGHSLGLSHPFYTANNEKFLKPDFSALPFSEFNKIGFKLTSSKGLDKEYFTIMSYDDTIPYSGLNTFAQTPMILDVIALQKIYGSGTGTSGLDNSTITPGTGAYRTYFDSGGTDTIDLTNYTFGAYLNLGQSLVGVDKNVGVLVSNSDYVKMQKSEAPGALRWLYGDYENAIGSTNSDAIIGNLFNNYIYGGLGNDFLIGNEGNDTLIGGQGDDRLIGGIGNDTLKPDSGSDTVEGGDGTDSLSLIGKFADYNYIYAAGIYKIQNKIDTTNTVQLSGIEIIDFNDISASFSSIKEFVSDTTAPTVTTFNPADEATTVAIGANVVLTFNEAVQRGTGIVVLKTAAGVVVATYDATTSTNLNISGSTLTIDPTADLGYSTGYKLELDAGSIKDITGNSYVGVSDYNFTTESHKNALPTGSITIGGTATQGQTLTAANTLADLDGLGTISYQWSSGGVAISGATASTYVLTQAEVGKAITVAASYTDGFGAAESMPSSATAAVANVNDSPIISSGATASVAENTATTTVLYTASASDPDASDTKTWSLSGTDASLLTIDSSGQVTLKAAADFEAKASYSFSVVATDAGGLSASKAVVLSVTNVNETPVISSNVSALKAGETATITFTFNELPLGFVDADIVTTGGTLGAISGSGFTRTATFTPTANLASGTASIKVASGIYADVGTNTGGAGTMPSISIDTLAPTLAITTPSASIASGSTATITFTASETPATVLTAKDFTVAGGALSGFAVSNSDSKVYTATFTADGTEAISISSPAGAFTDAAGNSSTSGSTPSIGLKYTVTVSDAYVTGATVYLDVAADGSYTAGTDIYATEGSTAGTYTFTVPTGTAITSSSKIITEGGLDTVSDGAVDTMSTGFGKTTVSYFSTLYAAATTDAAKAALLTQYGMGSTYSDIDPYAAMIGGSTSAALILVQNQAMLAISKNIAALVPTILDELLGTTETSTGIQAQIATEIAAMQADDPTHAADLVSTTVADTSAAIEVLVENVLSAFGVTSAQITQNNAVYKAAALSIASVSSTLMQFADSSKLANLQAGDNAAYQQTGSDAMATDLATFVANYFAASTDIARALLISNLAATYSSDTLPEIGSGMNLKQALQEVFAFRSDYVTSNASATEQQINTAIGSTTPISNAPGQTGLLFGMEITNPKQAISRRDVEDIASAKGLVIGDDITMLLSPVDMTPQSQGISLKYSLSKYMDSGLDFVKFDKDFSGTTQTGANKFHIAAVDAAPTDTVNGVSQIVAVTITGLGNLAGGTTLLGGVGAPGSVGPTAKKIPVFDENMNVVILLGATDDRADSGLAADGVINVRPSLSNLDQANIDKLGVQSSTVNGSQYRLNLKLGRYDAVYEKALSSEGASTVTHALTFDANLLVTLTINDADAPSATMGKGGWAGLSLVEAKNVAQFLKTAGNSGLDALEITYWAKTDIDSALTGYGLGTFASNLSTAENTGVTYTLLPTMTISSGASASVAENTATSTVLYTASAIGPVAGYAKTWSLSGTDASLLTIDASTGALTLKAAADFEAKTSYSFSVVATDAVGMSASKAIALSVTNVNDLPTGDVTIAGIATAGQTLTASNTLADQEGLGTVSYMWSASGVAITGATSSAYVLTQAEAGKAITAAASYTDGQGTLERATSAEVLVSAGKTVEIQAYSWKAHTLLDGVAVGIGSANQSTGSVGSASFAAITDTAITLSATRSVPSTEATTTSAAVNLQDAIAILKMIVGLEVNGTGKALSPYQALAADYDGNGQVQLSDAIGVLKHVVGLTAPDPTWYFVNEIDSTVPAKASLAPGVPQTSITAALSGTSPVHVGLVGYLSGDVDGSFAGADGAVDLDLTQSSYFIDLLVTLGLNASQFGIY